MSHLMLTLSLLSGIGLFMGLSLGTLMLLGWMDSSPEG